MLVSQQQEDEAFLKAPATNGNLAMGSFKVYPNPVADVLNVEYVVEDDTPLSIDLVNTVGQTVFTKNYGIQSKGVFSTSIQTAELAKGFYTIIIKAGGKQSVQKVVH